MMGTRRSRDAAGRSQSARAAFPTSVVLATVALTAVALAAGCALPFGAPKEARAPGFEGPPIEPIRTVARQPFASQVLRLVDAMSHIGAPLRDEDVQAIFAAASLADEEESIAAIQRILAPYTLVDVHINPESRVKLARGPARAALLQDGWRAFLVRVHNEPGITAQLRVTSRNAAPAYDQSAGVISEAEMADRWMSVSLYKRSPMVEQLSGLSVEYRIIEVYSRDRGPLEGHLAIDIGQGSQDLGFRNDLFVLFEAEPSARVTLGVKDERGQPTTASFIFEDDRGRVYPYSAKRAAPDFFFHDQVYRSDGETIRLPAGKFQVTLSRGPEYLTQKTEIEVFADYSNRVEFSLERWIDPNGRGWYSGDHHIHAAGCLHYKSPTIGVEPETMMRHLLGEGLNVGAVLTWGPGWYHQKRNFTGRIHPLSTGENLLRYDVEVSGFPSDAMGHLCLLRLGEDDYPGADEKEQWPSWDFPILKWAKAQGAVVGVAHSGWGLDVFPEARLPNYRIPPMDGIGAQEFLVDLAHDAIDFMSTVDTPYVWELNTWYHALNCGFEPKISGETDFPCIFGDRVGVGRSYVNLGDEGLDFDAWVDGIKAGRAYVSDGMSHLMDFQVGGAAPGDAQGGRLELDAPTTVTITAVVAARLEPAPERIVPREGASWQIAMHRIGRDDTVMIRDLPYNKAPYWHLERARIGSTGKVPVEVVVNGRPVARQEIEADGELREIEFEVAIERSSWVALRILASSHTNAVTVLVGERPVRASKLSAQWCLDAIDKVWVEKYEGIRRRERLNAGRVFAEARTIYRAILEEAYDDSDSLGEEDRERWDREREELQEAIEELDRREAEQLVMAGD